MLFHIIQQHYCVAFTEDNIDNAQLQSLVFIYSLLICTCVYWCI